MITYFFKIEFCNYFFHLDTKRNMAEKNPQSQTDDQKSDKKTTEKPWCSPNLLVAAIDFGTTYSGYAFSSRADFDDDPLRITAHKWSSDLISEKNPTSILFDNNQKLVAFGYEAEKQFTELSNDNRHEDFYYFQRFKMQLYHHDKDAKNKVFIMMYCLKFHDLL